MALLAEPKETEKKVKAFLDALREIPKEQAFNADDYAIRLCMAARSTSSLKHFKHDLLPSHTKQTNTSFDQLDCKDAIEELTAATMARAMTNNDDRFGFKNVVDKDKAVKVSKKALCNLAPRLYGDYLNQRLAEAKKPGVVSLENLRTDAKFVEEFEKTIKMPSFQSMMQMHQQAADSYQYTTSLIYSYQYFQHGPSFQLDKSVEEAAKAGTAWTSVISSWIDRSAHSDVVSLASAAEGGSRVDVMNLVSSLCGAVMHDEIPDNSVVTLGSLVKNHLPIANKNWEIMEQHEKLETLGTKLWSAWDRQMPHFNNAAADATSQSTERLEHGRTINTGRGSVGMPPDKVITYAEGAATFLEDYRRLGFYTGSLSNREERKQVEHGVSGCFRPGTKVLTDNGDVNIEDVCEGLRIVTRAAESNNQGAQYGTCSDETVKQSLVTDYGTAHLWGFNDRRPFFSANHVFFTTTGMRAIDPVAALRENPWLDVGQLSVGHMLLYSPDGKGYEQVQIQRLYSEEADCLTVHGIHLREGLRSYHADGFLVFLNYPEITLKGISRLLQPLDSGTRLSMLKNISELQPLFNRWGAGTISDLLSQEIGCHGSSTGPDRYHGPNVRMKREVQHLTQRWTLEHENANSSKLPIPSSIEVYEGVLLVDGEHCPNANLRGKEIFWSKDIQGQVWQHGHLFLDSKLTIAHGDIAYSKDFDSKLSTERATVIAIPGSHPVQPLFESNTFQESKLVPQFSMLMAQPQMSVATAGIVMDEAISTTKVNATGADSFDFGEIGAPVVHIPLPQQTYRDVGTYSLLYDAADWDDHRVEPKDPQQFLEMTTCIDDQTLQFTCSFPLLDAIRDAACDELRKSAPVPLDPQLTVHRFLSPGAQNTCYRIEIINPTYWQSSRHRRNNTFVFSIMEIELSYNAAELTAFVRKFDPMAVGGGGDRHLVTGSWTGVSANIVRTEVVAKAAALQDNMFFAMSNNFTSRIVSQSAALMTDKNGAEKLSGLDLSLEKLESDTQNLIHNAMLYHMDENQRKHYTGQNRPIVGNYFDEVPIELGPNLNQPTADWLKNKYIPMWIANRIMSMSEEK